MEINENIRNEKKLYSSKPDGNKWNWRKNEAGTSGKPYRNRET